MKSNCFFALTLFSSLTLAPFVRGQDQSNANQPNANQPDTKQRARAARDLAKQGQDAIPALQRYLKDTDLAVRLEAVKAVDEIGGPKTVDALVVAAADSDP